MSQRPQVPETAPISHADGSEFTTTFRVFSARLPLATSEALRVSMHLKRADIDLRMPQPKFAEALSALLKVG